MRIAVLGGAGNFGARIVRALQDDPSAELIAAGRRSARVPGAEQVRTAALDIDAPDLAARIAALSPELVIHCVGPFQGQDYRVAQATLAAGAHYLDLADGRDFVSGFSDAIMAAAGRAGRSAITGASTLPGLSFAVLEKLCEPLSSVQDVEIAIAPGQRAPRGAATLAAVFSYLGRPVSVWQRCGWQRGWGWMDLRRIRFDFGSRWGALCDVPDLALLPQRIAGLRSAQFHAALEIGVQHLVLWKLAALRRVGVPLAIERYAAPLNRAADVFNAFGGEYGGMRMSVVGLRPDGHSVRRTWQLTAPALHGPEIPCMAAILLVRRMLQGQLPQVGARACIGELKLAEFEPEFSRWGIRTRIEEIAT